MQNGHLLTEKEVTWMILIIDLLIVVVVVVEELMMMVVVEEEEEEEEEQHLRFLVHYMLDYESLGFELDHQVTLLFHHHHHLLPPPPPHRHFDLVRILRQAGRIDQYLPGLV